MVTVTGSPASSGVAAPVSSRRPRVAPPRSGEPWWGRWWATLAAWALGQLATVSVVAAVAADRHRPLAEALRSWDGAILLAIARDGYRYTVPAGNPRSPAFLPGYPGTVRLVHASGVLTWPASGLAVSIASGAMFALGLHRLTRGRSRTASTPLVLAALCATAPMGVVFLMTYTEALFGGLAVWALVCTDRRRWLSAAVLCLLAGTVRTSGLALAAAVMVAAAIELVRVRPRWRVGWRALVAIAVAPLGTLGWLWWVGRRAHEPRAWFEMQQQGWGSRIDFGAFTARYTFHALVDVPSVLDPVTVAVLLAGGVLLGAGIRLRLSPAWLVYAAGVLAMDALSAGIWNSKVRLLVPAFTLFVPLVIWLHRQSSGVRIGLLLAFAAFGTWYSAYALLVYGYAI